SSRRRHTRSKRDWSSDVCSSDLGARYFFHVEKVPKKTPGTPRSPIVYLIGLYQTWDSGATESGFWHLIYSGSIDDASAAALLKRSEERRVGTEDGTGRRQEK